MHGNADKVLQEKSVLLKNNSVFTPHNQYIRDLLWPMLFFATDPIFLVKLLTVCRTTIKYKLNLNQPVTGCFIWLPDQGSNLGQTD